MTDSLTLEGVPALLRKLDNPTWAHKPVRNFMNQWAIKTESETTKNIKGGKGGWIDNGLTKASVAKEVDPSPLPLWARVGSNKDTFRWGEYGTGLLSEDPESKKRRFLPPAEPLEAWALRKRIKDDEGKPVSGQQIAWSIWKKGGLEPRRYLRDADDTAREQIPKYLRLLGSEIETEAARGVV